MLQQTRVETVIDYYHRWLEAFPTIEALAAASESRVLKMWEGLGYYSRARNLHRAAKAAQGNIPDTVEGLQEMPGIGRYTAGAIASIAFNQRAPLVDGNVIRIFARIFGIADETTKPKVQQQMWLLAEELLPDKNCGDFNQSLMELGAMICVPQNPDCAACPMQRVCVAKARNLQDQLPNRGARKTIKRVTHDVTLIRNNGKILLQKRPANGLLANMWELPPGKSKKHLLTIRHAITDKQITLRVFAGEPPITLGDLKWISNQQLKRITMSAAHRKAVAQLTTYKD